MCVRADEADRLRQQKREREAREPFEREKLAAQRKRDREAAEVAAAVQQERQQQIRDRERRLEQRTGASLAQIEAEMRRALWMQPGAGGTLAEGDRIASVTFSLEDLERFVETTFGPLEGYEHAS
jgi:hypothetical protein